MKKTAYLPLGLCLLMLACGSAYDVRAQDAAHAQADSLYKRLGGYEAIAAVTDDFVGRLIKDEKLTRFFTGASTDTRKRIRQHIVDQLCEMAGGPCIYTGRTMKTSHAGLGITEGDWDSAVKHLIATLDKFKVGKTEKDDLLKALTGIKPDIVEKK